MPVFTVQTPTGAQLDIEAADEATALNGAQQWHAENAPKPDAIKDVASGFDSGVASGVAGLGALPGIVTDLGAKGIGAASDFVSDTLGVPRYQPPAKPGPIAEALGKLPTYESMSKEIQNRYYGGAEPYKPQTKYGEYAHSVGEMVPGVAGGEGTLLMKGAQAIGAGVGAEGLGEYFKGTALEPYARMVGGLFGGTSVAGGSKAVEGARNFNAGKSTGAEIAKVIGGEDLKPGAVKRVGQNVTDEELTAPQAAAKADQLGPDAMLLDMGHQLEGRADFMAQSPGKAQNTIYRPIADRVEDVPAQLKSVLDKHMGPSQDIVQLQNQIEDFSKKYVSPAYKALEEKYPVLNDGILQDLAQRPVIKEAMSRAENLAKNYGEDLGTTETKTILHGDGYHIADDVQRAAQPSIRYWDYVKKGLDQRINGMMRNGIDDLSSAQKADLGGLLNAKNALVEHLDNLTGGEYAQVRRLAATKPAMQEAVDFGRSIFSDKLLPEEVAAHVKNLSIPEQRMVEIGARREIENRVGAPGDEGRKLRSLLSSPNNSQKLTNLLGSAANGEIQNSVAAADQFQRVSNKIHNSRTATRIAGMNDTNAPAFNQNPTILGAAAALPRMGMNYALEHGMANTRDDISRILTAKGDQIDPVVKALLNYNATRASNAATPLNQQAATLIRALISGAAGR